MREGNTIRIVYMGTPEFAVPALDALSASNHDVVGVVTQPDRARGRGHKLVPSPVKKRAVELDLSVCEPESLRDGGHFRAFLDETSPDLIVVCAYGKILPKDTLGFPRLGCVNIHASLLPKYRGAAPIHRAIENGETETGITLMRMSEGLDEGDMIASRIVKIQGMDTGEATQILSKTGAVLLMDTLAVVIDGSAACEPQDGAMATYAPPVTKEEGRIDFHAEPAVVVQKILAMTPAPGAYAYLNGDKVKLARARALTDSGSVTDIGSAMDSGSVMDTGSAMNDIPAADAGSVTDDIPATDGADAAHVPGKIIGTDGGEIEVCAAGGTVGIARIQAPGGKMMNVSDYLRGHPLGADATFE